MVFCVTNLLNYKEKEIYQKEKFKGFTTNTLFDFLMVLRLIFRKSSKCQGISKQIPTEIVDHIIMLPKINTYFKYIYTLISYFFGIKENRLKESLHVIKTIEKGVFSENIGFLLILYIYF